MHDYKIIKDMYEDTPLSIQGKKVRADWYRAGEGFCGDYNPNNPDDEELLRFDIYYREDENAEWKEVEDASYCTFVSVDDDEETKEFHLIHIWKEYNDVLFHDTTASVKKLGERLSWVGSGCA